jgi:autotransporter-associated beta strand protein
MTSATWQFAAADGNYDSTSNWTKGNKPGAADTAYFDDSKVTNVNVSGDLDDVVGQWIFIHGSPNYVITILGVDSEIDFYGAGIVAGSNNVNIITKIFGTLDFYNNSSAGTATLTVLTTELNFWDCSTAGNAVINVASGIVGYWDSSSAGSSIITVTGSGLVEFEDDSNAGGAQLIANGGGTSFDFSFSAGPGGSHHLTAGSIAGSGTFHLGSDQLAVGSNGHSTNVSGLIADGGGDHGSGASLVKVGKGTLTLSGANNSYSGGTTLEQGTLDLAAIGAAGPGAISFAGKATLKIENAALSGHIFTNTVDFFARHDVLDVAGLLFHAGAKATYHKTNHHLTIRSGGVTDTFTLNAPHSTHFQAASDHHGDTEVFLVLA